jgi:DNA-binding response OmpR family regulator
MPTILIIDDEAGMRTLIRLWLAHDGYSILEANNGQQGELMALELNPDVILLDVMMPGQNGYTTCANLRAKGYTGRIALVSALSTKETAGKALEHHADGYIAKPVAPSVLRHFIQEAS